MASNKKGGNISNMRRSNHPACPEWTPDAEEKVCVRCKSGFSLTNRRHHCRSCGRLFDANCCSEFTDLSQIGFPANALVRVCVECADKSNSTKQLEKELNLLCQNVNAKGSARVKISDLAKSLCDAVNATNFHPNLLEYGRKIFAQKIEDDAKEAHGEMVHLRTLGESAKVSEILPVTNLVEDLLDALKRISGKAIADDFAIKDAVNRIGLDEFNDLYESVKQIRELKMVSQREDARYRECKANLEAVVSTNYTYEYTKEVVELALHYLDQGRVIPKSTLERAQAKLKVMEQVDKRIAEHQPKGFLVGSNQS
eukprot:TRINITY_DN5234_c0_g1_i1.p1 TRINITY_DN5234_c0_g1~~TRINITY_DN5234_c0_g1_i1.p1  ORF type:complete len:312 (+),score=81.17 TRINITY_DN5234_c0_g1_i1:74-1009(+)